MPPLYEVWVQQWGAATVLRVGTGGRVLPLYREWARYGGVLPLNREWAHKGGVLPLNREWARKGGVLPLYFCGTVWAWQEQVKVK